MAVSAIANTITDGGVPEKARSGEAFSQRRPVVLRRRFQLRLVLIADQVLLELFRSDNSEKYKHLDKEL